MTKKYCDHGAYGAAVFNGYISNAANNDNGVAGNILTVTSVTSPSTHVCAVTSKRLSVFSLNAMLVAL